MSLNSIQIKWNEYFLEQPDSCGTTPEGEGNNRPQAEQASFEQRDRIINQAWLFTVTDHGVHDFTILVRKDI